MAGGNGVDEQPIILVIEDEYSVQGLVEEWLAEGGFGTDILSSGVSKTTARSLPM
jgi:DNA-binding response OmpR family regulator